MRRPLTFQNMISEPGSSFTSRSCGFNNIDEHSSSSSDDDISIGASSCQAVVGKVELRRSITLFGVVVILVANIGGTGVFIAPSMILKLIGSPGVALILWCAGGFIQLCLAFCVAELTQFFGRGGGPYFYITSIFGSLAGFLFLLGYVIFVAAPLWALGAYTASLYLLSLVFTDCSPPEVLVKLLAAWILMSMVVINCTYRKAIFAVQKFLTSCKVIALVLISILGFVNIYTEAGQKNIGQFMEGTTAVPGQIAIALLTSYFGFGGWSVITVLAEEVKSPEKNLPRGLGVSFAVMVTTALTANFAYYVVLSKEESLRSEAVAMLFGQMIHSVVPVMIAILVCLSSIGILNILILSQPRIITAAARNGHMPKIMAMLHRDSQAPWSATVTLGLISIISLTFGTVTSLVENVSLYSGFMVLLLLLGLLILRWRQPGTPGQIKMPIMIPILAFLVTAVLVTMSLIEMPRKLGFLAAIAFLGFISYFLCIKLPRPNARFRFVDVLGFFLQVVCHLRYEDW